MSDFSDGWKYFWHAWRLPRVTFWGFQTAAYVWGLMTILAGGLFSYWLFGAGPQ